MEVVMNAKGWTNEDFKLVSELKAAERYQALCDNKIDAMVYVVGHPNGSIKGSHDLLRHRAGCQWKDRSSTS